MPKQLDVLSIDLDTVDIWVMESILSHYRPRVFEIEHMSTSTLARDFKLQFPPF